MFGFIKRLLHKKECVPTYCFKIDYSLSCDVNGDVIAFSKILIKTKYVIANSASDSVRIFLKDEKLLPCETVNLFIISVTRIEPLREVI